MLKKIVSIFAAAVMAFTMSLTSYAVADKNVVDKAKILTGTESSAMKEQIEKISAKYGVDIVIYTVSDTDGKEPEALAEELFFSTNCGFGSEKDGMLLLIVDKDGKGADEFCFSTSGWVKDSVYNDYSVKRITKLIKSDMKKGRYDEASISWLKHSAKFMKAAKNNKPYNEENVYRTAADVGMIIGFWAAAGIALGVVLSVLFRRSMKTHTDNSGKSEEQSRSIAVTKQRDIFIYSKEKETEQHTDHADSVRKEIDVFGGSNGKY